jgi:RNA polymerase sigma-70 factor (ECF subfamily)
MSKPDSLEIVYKNTQEDLIRLCQEGNQRAQLEIYKTYYRAMYNASLRIVNNTAEAEDIMQDSFLDAFQHLNEYKGTSSFGSWLKRIVINNSLDALKKNTGLSFVEEYDHEIPEEDDQEDDGSARVEEIKKGISELPDDYRVVLSLYLLEGYDHEEIGDILKISGNTSRIRYFRAKQKLLEIIRENRIRKFIL